MEINEKEYNSVVLAALLHDVGKLLHRGGGEYECTHEEASYKFITRFSHKIKNDKLYNIDLVGLIARHHDPKKLPKTLVLNEPLFKNKSHTEKNKLWKLIAIGRRADSYSCAERDRTGPMRKGIDQSKAPLDSIFSIVNLGSAVEPGKDTYRYTEKVLTPLSSFPKPIKEIDVNEMRGFIKTFEENIPDCTEINKFDDVLSAWLNILEKYTWAVPSDTRYETSDVSLYDHLRSSAAIAACLYKRHIKAIDQLKDMKTTDEFVFVGGDFSGIQDYIFDITNRGSGGASKRLRARSFFISLFSEVSIHKILHTLELPLLCNIFSAGGKFLMLAPNIAGVEHKLNALKAEIEQEIHETFFSQFSFLISWKTIKGFKNSFRKTFEVYSFFKAADDMFHGLESEKASKLRGVLLKNKSSAWADNAFKADTLYKSYEGSTDCKICGKGPALYEDPETGENEACPICYRDKHKIGQALPKVNYVAFGKGSCDAEKDNRVVIFRSHHKNSDAPKEGYFVDLLKEFKKDDKYYLVNDICTTNVSSPQLLINKYYANHVPVKDGNILSFKEIAELSRWDKKDKTYGSDMLGVLKADIDNLGLIFSKGFENPTRAEKRLRDIDRKTVSRFLTLSRMTELFFSGWMKDVMEMESKSKDEIIEELTALDKIDKGSFKDYLTGDYIDFQNIYTVYSGGDDLVLVGPWETMIVFSIYLNQQFRRYTCQNEHITLSAGLTFVKEKYPIASAIKQAETLLEKSKKDGKNRITLFGTTVEWEKLPKVINFFLFLNEQIGNDEKRGINTAFLYRLFSYHKMALQYFDNKNIEGLKYISALSYDVGRNIVEWDRDGKIKKGYNEYEGLQKIINEKPDSTSLIYNIKVPLFWTLFRNRRALKNENYNSI